MGDVTNKVFSTSIKLFKEYLDTLDEKTLIKRFSTKNDTGVDTKKMLKTIGKYVIHDCSHINKNKDIKSINMNWVSYCMRYWFSFYLNCDDNYKRIICELYSKMVFDRRKELNSTFNSQV